MTDSTDRFAWPEPARAGVSLSFDGAIESHLSQAVPALNAAEVSATFFLEPAGLLADPTGWRMAVARGHEVGSHSLFRVTDEGRLPNWTLEMVRQDIKMNQKLIEEVLGVEATIFALPGPDTVCAEGNYLPVVDRLFDVCRTALPGLNRPSNLDLRRLTAVDVKGLPLGALIDLTSDAAEAGASIILTFEEIEPAHLEFIEYLGSKREELWIAPVGKAAEYLASQRVEVA